MMFDANNAQDARMAIKGFEQHDGYTAAATKRKNRMANCGPETAKNLFASSQLSLKEQQRKTNGLLKSNPEKMVYWAHTKDDRDRCAKWALNHALQAELVKDKDICAVVNHKVSLLSADPDPKIKAEIGEAIKSGHKFYDEHDGKYTPEAIMWIAEELFGKDSLLEINLADKSQFMENYAKYANGACRCAAATTLAATTFPPSPPPPSPPLTWTDAQLLSPLPQFLSCGAGPASTGRPSCSRVGATLTWTASQKTSSL
jgi:hypothetical protein